MIVINTETFSSYLSEIASNGFLWLTLGKSNASTVRLKVVLVVSFIISSKIFVLY